MKGFLRISCVCAALFAIALSVICSSCSHGSLDDSILPDSCQLRPGDLVFRRGLGFESYAVDAADHEGEYSHVGIVAEQGDSLVIVHAVPGEPDFKGDPDRVKIDTPQKFYCTARAKIGEICRPLNSDAAVKASQLALDIYRQGMEFDHDYNDVDHSKMYCCELIEYVFDAVDFPLSEWSRHRYDIPGIINSDCMMPSDLCNSDKVKSIYHF